MFPSLFTIYKVGFAITDLPRFMRKTSQPRLIMTLLVKNEEEMLEQNLIFHKRMGVDGFIVTDNNSTDCTLQILQKYQRKGWVLAIIHEKATNYEQKQWVDRMVWMAKRHFAADWVINADADEFWYNPSHNLKKSMATTRANVLKSQVRSVFPEEGSDWTLWHRTVRCVSDYEKYGLSRYSLFERQNMKVAHRTSSYLQISMGNHKVTMLPRNEQNCDIIVFHYNIRSREQFMTKMINGGRQLELHKGKHGGRHWRYFYDLYKKGVLSEEYDSVVGYNCYNHLLRDGLIVPDCPLPALFKRTKA